MRTLPFLLLLALLCAAAAPSDEELAKDGWSLIYEKDAIKAFRRSPEGSKYMEFRGQGEIAASMYKVAAVIKDVDRVCEWLADCADARLVRAVGPDTEIKYNRTTVGWPVNDRDFVYEEKILFNANTNTITIRLRSVEDAGAPEVEGVVRATLLLSEYEITWIDENRSWVVVRMHTNPEGKLPTSLVNSVTKSWPFETMSNLRRQSTTTKGYDAWISRLRERFPVQ